MQSNRLACRNREEFFTIVDGYLRSTGLSLNKLGAFSVGDGTILSRAAKKPTQRLYLDVVDRVLTFIELNPKGLS